MLGANQAVAAFGLQQSLRAIAGFGRWRTSRFRLNGGRADLLWMPIAVNLSAAYRCCAPTNWLRFDEQCV